MNILKVMKESLDQLEYGRCEPSLDDEDIENYNSVIANLREAINSIENREPVVWMDGIGETVSNFKRKISKELKNTLLHFSRKNLKFL